MESTIQSSIGDSTLCHKNTQMIARFSNLAGKVVQIVGRVVFFCVAGLDI